LLLLLLPSREARLASERLKEVSHCGSRVGVRRRGSEMRSALSQLKVDADPTKPLVPNSSDEERKSSFTL
jgi:hypothetical protein